MREIKFRQPLRLGGFHYWGYLRDGEFVGPVGPNDAVAESEEFTGLYDKNSVEIYKRDICRHESLPGAKDGLLVVFENMGYKLKGKMLSDDIILCDNSSRYIEVIGNIHEGIK